MTESNGKGDGDNGSDGVGDVNKSCLPNYVVNHIYLKAMKK